MKIFVDEFEVVTNKRDAKALEAEFSNKTITYKTVHLLLSLGYEGVLAGLMNYILHYIKITDKNSAFDLKRVQRLIKKLANDSTAHKEIHEQAKILWQHTLMGEDYKKPKDIANKLIKSANKNTGELLACDANLVSSDLDNWLNEWRYRSSSVKVRILFARLIQLTCVNGKLTSTQFSHNIAEDDAKKLHLDHMEPTNPNSSNPNDYYKFGSIERNHDVDALGNMFPLPGGENISKSNDPMKTIFTYLVSSGLGNHWLTGETKQLYNSNKDKSGVPTQKFFINRKKYLIKMFDAAIRL